ncbi:MAG: protein kinase domain-containing protein [Planctomycetota bacterium]
MDEETRNDTLFEKIALDLGFINEKKLGEAKKFQKDLKSMDMPVLPLSTICLKKKLLTEPQIGQIERAIKSLESENVIPGYQITSKIAQGSLGMVYKAFQTVMERTVCLKVLDPDLAEEERWVRKFMNQGKVLARLSHPNICNGYDAGKTGDRCYVAVEYIPGLNVKELLEVQIKLEEAEAIKVIEQIAEALEHASSKGIVHRDIKPESIIVRDDGTAKLCDYGLALEDEEISEESPPGNPFYMSPEQAKGFTDIDVRSDIYSLGATFFHMVTGQVPFGGDDPFEIMTKHIMEPTPVPRDADSELSEATSSLILRMMASEADERFQNVTELLRAIKDVKVKRLMEEPAPIEVIAPPEVAIEDESAEPENGPVVRRRRRGKKLRPRTRGRRSARREAIREAIQSDLVGQDDIDDLNKAAAEFDSGAPRSSATEFDGEQAVSAVPVGPDIDIPDDIDLEDIKPLTTEDADLPEPKTLPGRPRPAAVAPRRPTRAVYADEPEPIVPQAKSHKGLIAAVIVVLLLGIGIVVLSVMSKEQTVYPDEFGTSTVSSRSTSTVASTQAAAPTATAAVPKPVEWKWRPEFENLKKFVETNMGDAKKVLENCDAFMLKAEGKKKTEAYNACLSFKKKYVLSRWNHYSGKAQAIKKKNDLRGAIKIYQEFLDTFGKFPEVSNAAESGINGLKQESGLKWQRIKREVTVLSKDKKYTEAMKKLRQAEKELLDLEVKAAKDARDQIKDAFNEQRRALSKAAEEQFLTLSNKIREQLARSEIELARQEVQLAMIKSDIPLFKGLCDDLIKDIDRIISARKTAEEGIRKTIGLRETFFFPGKKFKAGKVVSYDKGAIKIDTGVHVETVFFKRLTGFTILNLVHKIMDKEDVNSYLNVGLYSLYVLRDQEYASEMFSKANEKGAEGIERYRRLIGEMAFADTLKKGNDFFERGRFLDAVEEFSKVLSAIENIDGMEAKRKVVQDRIKSALEKSGITKLLNGKVDYRNGQYHIYYDFAQNIQLFDFNEYIWNEKKKSEPSWSTKNGKMAAVGKKLMRWRGSFEQRTDFRIEFDAYVIDGGAGFEVLVAADGKGYRGKCYLVGFGASFKDGAPREVYFGKLRSRKLTKLGAEGSLIISSGRNYHAAISYTSGFYRIYVDGRKILEIAEKSYTGGTVVFRAVNGQVQFDNIIFMGKIDPDWLKKSG